MDPLRQDKSLGNKEMRRQIPNGYSNAKVENKGHHCQAMSNNTKYKIQYNNLN